MVEDKDRGWKNIQKKLAILNDLELAVGVQGREAKQTKESGPTVAMVASVHEFGSPKMNIPQRSFIRTTVDEGARTIAKMTRAVVEEALDPKSNPSTMLRKAKTLGVWLQGRIRNKIVQIRTPPLSPATIKRKGSSNPLIDTGQLKSSITYQLRSKGKVL